MMGRRKKNEPVVTWAQGDPAQVDLTISNPLPFELRVEKMVSARRLNCHIFAEERRQEARGMGRWRAGLSAGCVALIAAVHDS